MLYAYLAYTLAHASRLVQTSVGAFTSYMQRTGLVVQVGRTSDCTDSQLVPLSIREQRVAPAACLKYTKLMNHYAYQQGEQRGRNLWR